MHRQEPVQGSSWRAGSQSNGASSPATDSGLSWTVAMNVLLLLAPIEGCGSRRQACLPSSHTPNCREEYPSLLCMHAHSTKEPLDAFSYSISYPPSPSLSSPPRKAILSLFFPFFSALSSPPHFLNPSLFSCCACCWRRAYLYSLLPDFLCSCHRHDALLILFRHRYRLFRNRSESIRSPHLDRQRLQHGRSSQRCASP
jgi:hypothetical protein